MDQRRFQKLLRRTVLIPVVLLVLLAVTLVVEILSLTASLRWVDHTDQVIANSRQLMRYMLDMETGLRGYHLTGDAVFLDSYNSGKPRVAEQLALLKYLIRDNPEQQARLREIGDLDGHWTSYAERMLLQPKGQPLSSQDYLAGKGLMDQIRDHQREFIDAENRLQELRYHRSTVLTRVVTATAAGLSLLTAVLLFTLTRRELWELSANYEKHLRAEAEKTQELQQSREAFQITLKSIGDAVVSTDAAGRVSFLNPVAQQLTGWDYRDALGRRWRDVLRINDEKTRTEIDDPTQTVRQTQTIITLSNNLALTSRSGQEFPIELTAAPIVDNYSHLVGVVIVLRDVSQRRQTEQSLRASDRLAQAGRLSATIAHEIRNPLDTVSNLVYLLQHEQQLPEAAVQYLDMASDELARIAQITGQLLTFHREARTPVEVNLTDVLESVKVLFAPQIRAGHIEVDQRFETTRPVRGFPGELRQVFSNLVGNALEATPPGGKLLLHVRNSSLASDPSRQGVRVTLLDNGAGIPPGIRKNLFAPFYTTKGEKGTGLGLWVSRGIVEKHEGTIHVSSRVRPGKSGTAFSVFLPFAQTQGMLDIINPPPAL
ncbi:MAG: CHASE3 domain-containing protein [Acidobacteriota bacterium]|nr:CHASE3 domain-containing protein [Acidobacteriota bacterium]